MALVDRLAITSLSLLPRPLMRVLAARYIAGEKLESALERVTLLAEQGYRGILDILGEDVSDEAEARSVAAHYAKAATALARLDADVYVSVKPTHVGLTVDEALAHELYLDLARHCAELGIFVRVEMEDHTTTDATLRVFERLRTEVDNVGIVLQSRLRRTPDDIRALADGSLDVRMVKGVYLEPSEIAHTETEPIRRAFVDCTRLLLERGAYVGLATHDDVLADELFGILRAMDLDERRYELQVLLGVRESLWQTWRDAGHPVRVYVPYGPEWRAYSTRRLRKNPQILRHVVRDFFLRRR